jgi:hypothetical protein
MPTAIAQSAGKRRVKRKVKKTKAKKTKGKK